MTKLSLKQFGKKILLLIPQIRQLYAFSKAINYENTLLKHKLKEYEKSLTINIKADSDPKSVLTNDLPENLEAKYAELERRILYILCSPKLSNLPVKTQINWIKEIFTQCVMVHHPKSYVLAQLIDEYLTGIFKSEELSLSEACQLYDSMYGLYWCGAQSFLDMRGFDKYTVPLFKKFLKTHCFVSEDSAKSLQDISGNLRIGYFIHYANEVKGNALGPLMLELSRAHAKRKNRKIFVYCVQWFAPDYLQQFDGTEISVKNFPNQNDYKYLDELVDSIRFDEIDVLVTEVASSISTYVFAQRVAPCQIWLEPGYPFWSNSDVDWTLIPGKEWQPWFGIPHNRYSNLRLGLPLPNKGIEANEEQLKKASSLLPDGKKIFAVFTRLIKITPQYLEVVTRILTELPEAFMLIVGEGDVRLINSIISMNGLKGRVIVVNENVDLNVYGVTIDVFLDTFPFVGGLACRDVARHGKPVLSLLSGEWDILLHNERINLLLARSKEEYVNKAVQLVLDDKFYNECVAEQIKLFDKLTSDADMIQDIETAISSVFKIK